MIGKMLEKSKQYLEKTLSKNGKYLLALSGGPDSMALFDLIFGLGFSFEVIHIDHGWRAESKQEANILSDVCKTHSIPFHFHSISKSDYGEGNLEDLSRKKRYEIFKKTYDAKGFDAILLAHHADDQVETILKRVFEGSYLTHLSGIREDSMYEGMRVLRPLLFHYKSEIYNYLSDAKINFFEDATNIDPKFLRARMRLEMIPYLEELFGKGIRDNILLLGRRVGECMHYVQKQVDNKITYLHSGPFGHFLSIDHLREELEAETLLRKVFQKEKIDVSRGEVEKLISLIRGKPEAKKIIKGDWHFIVEREHLFLLKNSLDPKVEFNKAPLCRVVDDWKSIWSGSAAVYLPEDSYTIGAPILNAKMANGVELKEWYRIHKVPVFFRSWFPVLWKDNKIIGECLTGKSCLNSEPLYANHLLTLKM
jgi:tRNA(Ile)-lysidine synthase